MTLNEVFRAKWPTSMGRMGLLLYVLFIKSRGYF